MNINLKKFDDACRAVAQDALAKTTLTVGNEDKTEIGVGTSGPLRLSDLKKLQNGDSRIMDNIYMRGQLLSAIRESLMPLNADGSRSGLRSSLARAFLAQAEERLFGKLEKNKRTGKKEFGIKTAGADLDALTVKELIDKVKDFVASKQGQINLFMKDRSKMLPAHAKALAMINLADLVGELGLSPSEAGVARLEGFERFGKLLKFNVVVPGRHPRTIPAYLDGSGNLGLERHRDEFVRLVNDSFAFGKGANYADRLPPKDLQEVNKLLKLITGGEQTKYAKIYANEGKQAQTYESYLRTTFMTMLPRALERARKIQPQGEITIQTWWKALRLENTGIKLPAEGGATAAGNALMDALFERVLADFLELEGLSQDYVRQLTVDDAEQDKGKVASRFVQFLSDDTFGYEASIKFRKDPNVMLESMDMLNLQASMDTLVDPDFGIPALGKKIHDDHRAGGTKFLFGGKEIFQMGVSAKTEASVGICRLREKGKFSMKQIGLMVYALNHCEHSIPTLFKGVEHQANIDVDIQAVGPEEEPEMKVTYTIPLLVKKDGNTVELTTRNIVHTVVYSQDGGSRCESLKLVDAPDREQDKTMTLAEFEKMRIPKDVLPARKREITVWMERIATLDSTIKMFQKELQRNNLAQRTNDPLDEKKTAAVIRQIERAREHREGYLAKLNAPENRDIRAEVLEERREQIGLAKERVQADLAKLDVTAADYDKKKNDKLAQIRGLSDQEAKISEELAGLYDEDDV